jgi:two-component system cell cycle sensor histidine kinase/response regulator CckA
VSTVVYSETTKRSSPTGSPRSHDGSLTHRVLLIDDDEDEFVIVRDLLESARHDRYSVSWTASFDDGYNALMGNEYDVCLLDYRLGGHSGIDLVRRVIGEGCPTPVIILTGQGDKEIEEASMEAGATDYLTKSGINVEDVEHTIRHAIFRATATRRIHRAETMHDATIASILDTIMRVSRDGRILGYKSGTKSDPANGTVNGDSTLRTAFDAATAGTLEECLAAATLSGDVCSCEFTTAGVMNARHFEARFKPIGDGAESIAILRDFTKEKAAQRHMDELLQSQDRFLAGISHDLRTPLTSVLGYADLLATAGPSFTADERSEMISSIVSGATQLTYLFEDALVMARYEVEGLVTAPRKIDVERHIARALHSFAPDTTINVTSDVDRLLANADPMRLDQVLRHLVNNAIEYGGNDIAVAIGRADDDAWIEVRDDGDGIPLVDGSEPAELQHRSHGTGDSDLSAGLGLTVCRRLASAMGGKLTYHRDDGWSIFRLELPAVNDSIRHTTAEPDDAAELSSTPATLHTSGRTPRSTSDRI